MQELKLFDIDSADFNELIDNARVELKKKNDKYRKLQKEYYDLMNKFPNLRLIFEEDGVMELNKEECIILQKIIGLGLKISQMEDYAIFFLGGKQAYFYFKSMGILKE